VTDDDLVGIGAPARRALATLGVHDLRQLAGRSRADLLRLHGFGPAALRIIEARMNDRGLELSP
jgi:predicted flap endonuclease-1-like 5' DNA nuclease